MNLPSTSNPTGAKVCQFVGSLNAKDVPSSVLATTRMLFLDTLGVCIAATPMEAGVIARETAFRLYNAGDASGQSNMLFDGRKASIAGAAFAAATQTDNLDGHDGYSPTKGHIGVAALPALIAAAQHIPDLSGQDALTALLVGYEVAGRAGIALHASVDDYHTSGAWNCLGVAAIVARLRNLDAKKFRHALGIAEYHGPRSQMMREIANPTMLHDGSGMGALIGVSAVMMAEMGFTGAPALPVEDPDIAAHWTDLGTFWQMEHQYIKPYPVCRWAHAAIDAVYEISQLQTIDAAETDKIEIRSFHNAVQLFPTMPDTTSQAQYSLPFAVATFLTHGRIGLEHISGAGLVDPVVADLVARTTMTETQEHETRFPIGRWADVTLHLKNGRKFHSGDIHARGGPERPLLQDEIIEKFMEFSVPVLGEQRTTLIRDLVMGLDQPNMRFADLTQHLYAEP